MVVDRLSPLALPDLSGKLAIVTGATSGLGYATATALANAGAEVTLAVRNLVKGQAVVDQIIASGGKASASFIDLAQQDTIKRFVEKLPDRPVAILVNNAGMFSSKSQQLTVDGFELTMATNYFGHFSLTALLLDRLRAAKTARVVGLGSLAAKLAKIDPTDLNLEKRYARFRAYANSKLAVILFIQELHRRSLQENWGISAIAAHPGYAATNLFTTDRSATDIPRESKFKAKLLAPIRQSSHDGAQPIIYAAGMPKAVTGAYYGPNGFLEAIGAVKRTSLPKAAMDHELANQVWCASQELCGVSFPGYRS